MNVSSDSWDWLGGFLERGGLRGVAITVTNAEGAVSFVSKGWAELRRRAIDADTLFELGPIGKTYTALVTLQLADEGLLSREAPVTEYLPWFEVRSAYEPIRLEHLLTHSAGLVRGADLTADSRFDVWVLRETVACFASGAGDRHGRRLSGLHRRRPRHVRALPARG